jgi:hypothetical protein
MMSSSTDRLIWASFLLAHFCSQLILSRNLTEDLAFELQQDGLLKVERSGANRAFDMLNSRRI